MKGDEDDSEFVLGGPTAGAKRTSDGGAGATAKLATSMTAARMKARAKDRTNAWQDDPAKTGENPKAPPKSVFPFTAFIKNVLSGDEGKDDFVLEGPAAGAKGARARNTIATPSRLRHRRPKPMKKRAHAEALPILLARHSIEGMADYAPPGSTSNRQADDPQVPGAPFAALFAQTHEETGPRGSAFHFLGRHSIRGMTNQASPRSATNCHAHDPQVLGVPLAASFAQPHEETGPRGSAAHFFGRRSIGGAAN